MGTIIPMRSNSFLENMTTLVIRRQNPVVLGSTKKATEIAEAAQRGWMDGVVEGLTEYGNTKRIELFMPYKDFMGTQAGNFSQYVPGVYKSDVHAWLRGILATWNNGDWKDKTDDQWFEYVEKTFISEVVKTDDVQKMLDRLHKDGVKAGLIEPTAEDAAWIEEELNTYKAVSNPLEGLLAKVKG